MSDYIIICHWLYVSVSIVNNLTNLLHLVDLSTNEICLWLCSANTTDSSGRSEAINQQEKIIGLSENKLIKLTQVFKVTIVKFMWPNMGTIRITSRGNIFYQISICWQYQWELINNLSNQWELINHNNNQ